MKKHTIKKMGILLAALLLLICLPMPALAEKASFSNTATPSDMEKEEEIEEPGEEPEAEPEDEAEEGGLTVETGDPEEDPEEEPAIEEVKAVAVTVAETIAPDATKAQAAVVTEEDIAGTWTIDGVTSYRFKEGGKGALILPEHRYAFVYTLEEDELSLKFESAKIKKAVFRVSLEGDDLILTKEGGEGTAEYLLERIAD